MKAFMMAAGRGTRISRLIEEVPKSTLPVAGVPLIRLTAEMLLADARIDEIVICVGYQPEKIKEALSGLPITYCENPFYAVTNSIASLWFAREHLTGEALLLNADVFFRQEILELVMQSGYDAVMLADRSRIATGDYFFQTNENGSIAKYGKELPFEERSSEYVGIAKVSADFMEGFRQRLDDLVRTQQYSMWWENVLYSYVETGERDIKTIDVDGRFWAEIDFFDDYERILGFVRQNGGL